jgi:hypothetical protein
MLKYKERWTGGKERLEEEQRRGVLDEQRTRRFGDSFVALFGK